MNPLHWICQHKPRLHWLFLIQTPNIPTSTNSQTSGNKSDFSLLPNIDYKNAKLEDLLREVDSLELPEFESPIVLPPKDISSLKRSDTSPEGPDSESRIGKQ